MNRIQVSRLTTVTACEYLFSIDAITNAQKENKQFKSEIGV
jgi:hypothetical protein